MIIRNNLSALTAKNKNSFNIHKTKKIMEKLSSGYRINRSADDAAGLALSEKMRTQLRGLNCAVRNSQNGINLIQTFESALGETEEIIQRVKCLAEEAANGTYDNSTDRSAIELEFLQLCDEIDQIAKTDYNGAILLAERPSRRVYDGMSGIELRINRVINDTNAPDLEVSVVMCADNEAILNNPKVLKKLESYMEILNDEDIYMTIPGTNAHIPIPGTEGIDIYCGEGIWGGMWHGSSDILKVGEYAVMTRIPEADDFKSFSIYLETITSIEEKNEFGETPFETTEVGRIKIADIILKSSQSPVVITKAFGIDFKMDWFKELSHYEIYEDGLNYIDDLNLQVGARSKDIVNFSFKYASEGIGNLNCDLNCTANGLELDRLTLKTQESANGAIDKIDNAINKISCIRAVFGAVHNRLEHKIAALTVANENITESESHIRDTDIASEMTTLTSMQILQNTSQAMLAQSMQIPQNILGLLGT